MKTNPQGARSQGHRRAVEHRPRHRIAGRIAIESYREMISFVGQRDPTSRRLLESILAQKEEHAEDLVDLLEDLPKD
jgi:bacterioferritin